MKSLIRFGIAVGICLSGWALAPFVDLPRVAFGWEQYADAYSLIHRSVIPAAAVATGAEGAFFQTDVDINNLDSGGEASYELWWLPRGQDNFSPRRSQIFTIAGGHGVRIENVLTEVFGLQPDRVGSVVIASDSDRVIAMSRTYNVSDNKATGTFGQALPAVPADKLIQSGQSRRIIFFSEDPSTRANLGCVNGTDSNIEILADLYDSGGAFLGTRTMDLGPWGNDQMNRIFRGFEPVNGYLEVRSDTPGGSFYCYGSVLDNATSDPTTILPQSPSSGTTYYIPAAALASGSSGALLPDRRRHQQRRTGLVVRLQVVASRSGQLGSDAVGLAQPRFRNEYALREHTFPGLLPVAGRRGRPRHRVSERQPAGDESDLQRIRKRWGRDLRAGAVRASRRAT